MVSEHIISDDAVRHHRSSAFTSCAACLAKGALCKASLPLLRLRIMRVLQVQREAIQAVEQDGIVFIDEIDKIVVNQDLRYGEQLVTLSVYAPPMGQHVTMRRFHRHPSCIAQLGRSPLRGRPCSKRGWVL